LSNIVYLHDTTDGEVPPKNVTEAACNEEFSHVLVLGSLKNDEFYAASSTGDIGELLIMLEIVKDGLIKQVAN